MLAVAEVVHGHVIDDEVLDVLEDVEVTRPRADGARHVAEHRGHEVGGDVAEDRPVQRRARDEVELLVDCRLGQPRHPDHEEHEILGAERHAAAGADAGALAAELRRQEHREDDDVDAPVRADEGDGEQDERGDRAHRVVERDVRQALRNKKGADDGDDAQHEDAAGGRCDRGPCVL